MIRAVGLLPPHHGVLPAQVVVGLGLFLRRSLGELVVECEVTECPVMTVRGEARPPLIPLQMEHLPIIPETC